MALDHLRKKVIYQNTVDIWIASCQEKNQNWNDVENYKKFTEYLEKQNISMKKFPLCVSESDSAEPEKVKLAEVISESQDIDTFTIKLNDNTIDLIRKFDLKS